MGIVNVTPDSFSDGGRFTAPEAAVAHALALVEQGADLLDMGGESTRPGAQPVPEEEELRRVLPVIERLASEIKIPISIDTMKPAVARAALRAGASIINDVGANREEDEMWRLAADTGAGYVCVHMQGTPQTMQIHPSYGEVVAEVGAFFSERLQRLAHCGVASAQVILDPGIGFGKTGEHNLELVARLAEFQGFGRPLLLGVSRKSFLARGPGGVAQRLPAALACACAGVAAGVGVLRVHDVAETLAAVRLTEQIVSRARR